MLRAANIVLTPETVATYLAQMWISNIMQTVGWGLVASFFSTANGRLEIETENFYISVLCTTVQCSVELVGACFVIIYQSVSWPQLTDQLNLCQVIQSQIKPATLRGL